MNGNPYAGEVLVTVGADAIRARLTLGALAELETALKDDSLLGLVTRFEAGQFSSRDVLAVIVAGLRGGGWQGQAADLLTVDLPGGALGAAQIAASLLARAFTVPE
jgi:hypothetical protein